MKTTKKLLTLALAAMLLLSLAVPAMADDSDFKIIYGDLLEYHGTSGDVVIPDGVTGIMPSAFQWNADLTSITFPSSLTRIDAQAFWNCSGLKAINMPNSITEIAYGAFAGCTGLESVAIPSSVTVIGESAFAGCTGLESVAIPSSVIVIDEYAFGGCTGLKSVTISSGVTTINAAFCDCTGLKSVIIPASVTWIGYGTFSGCTSLTDVYFGGTQEQWAAIKQALIDSWLDHDEPTIFDDDVSPTIHCNSTGPGASTTPTTPVPSQSESAMPTNDQLTVNGALQSPTVYKIGGSNFFKIRDLAAMLSGTEKQFDVGYDAALKSVTLTTGKGYAKLDTDMAGAATGGNQAADPSNDSIYIDGQKIDVTVYKIGGNNFFMLRDLGRALGFYVGWTREDGVFIDTGKPYSD